MNNIELVKFCEEALKEGCGYVWGTFGNVLTHDLLMQKVRQYPDHVGSYENFIRSNWINKRTMDCAGLIKAYLWDKGGKPVYNPNTDFNVGMFATRAERKGLINTIPLEEIGLMVWKKGHIGVYVGNGRVIEANSTKKGVIETPITGQGSTAWTNWGECHLLEYLPAEQNISEWAKEAHKWVVKNNISDGSRPKDNVTREELWTMMYRNR